MPAHKQISWPQLCTGSGLSSALSCAVISSDLTSWAGSGQMRSLRMGWKTRMGTLSNGTGKWYWWCSTWHAVQHVRMEPLPQHGDRNIIQLKVLGFLVWFLLLVSRLNWSPSHFWSLNSLHHSVRVLMLTLVSWRNFSLDNYMLPSERPHEVLVENGIIHCLSRTGVKGYEVLLRSRTDSFTTLCLSV